MVVHSILKLLVAEADKPYMWGIILQRSKFDRFINQEIVPFLSKGKLVSNPVDVGSRPPSAQSEGCTVPGDI